MASALWARRQSSGCWPTTKWPASRRRSGRPTTSTSGQAPRETPPLSDAEFERVQARYEDNFGIDRDDGMDALRSSVGGTDLEGTGMKSAGD